MSREIKFRAWDKILKTMSNVQSLRFTDKSVSFISKGCSQPNRSQDSVELMQYTGLKDKNGKEIYEGDLYKQKGCMYPIEVYYDERCAEFKGRVNGEMQIDKTYNLIWHSCWEVIGNIYENPELLEKK